MAEGDRDTGSRVPAGDPCTDSLTASAAVLMTGSEGAPEQQLTRGQLAWLDYRRRSREAAFYRLRPHPWG